MYVLIYRSPSDVASRGSSQPHRASSASERVPYGTGNTSGWIKVETAEWRARRTRRESLSARLALDFKVAEALLVAA
jgi:hypothetical protein